MLNVIEIESFGLSHDIQNLKNGGCTLSILQREQPAIIFIMLGYIPRNKGPALIYRKDTSG